MQDTCKRAERSLRSTKRLCLRFAGLLLALHSVDGAAARSSATRFSLPCWPWPRSGVSLCSCAPSFLQRTASVQKDASLDSQTTTSVGYADLGPAEVREPIATAASSVPASTLFYHGFDKEARSFATMNELTYSTPEPTLTPENPLSNLKAQHALAVMVPDSRSSLKESMANRWASRKVNKDAYTTTYQADFKTADSACTAHLDETYSYVKPTFGMADPPQLEPRAMSEKESRGTRGDMLSSCNGVHLPVKLNTYPQSPSSSQ